MDYLKTVVPSQLMAERGSNLVVINPGSANVRMGFASQDVPFNIPHCIARRINPQEGKEPKFSVRDQMLNCRASSSQNAERESAYDIIAALMKIPFLDEEMPSLNQPLPPRMGRVDGFSSQQSRDDSKFTWTNVTERSIKPSTSIVLPNPPNLPDRSVHKDAEEDTPPSTSGDGNGHDFEENKYKEVIFGEDALKIPPSESYCLSRPIRRGHFNVSHNYSLHQVLEDLRTIWNWILTEKLHINPRDRGLYSAILVLGETFDNREIKEMMSIVLHDLGFSTAVVHQEALAAAFGNGLSTACVVNIGAQVTQVVCVEDGVALPHTALALPYGGDDISRCLLWVQRRHRTWPNFQTDPVSKPIDMLMLNKIKESYSQIRSGTFDAVTLVHSYDNERSAGHQKTRLSALNVPPMGLLYPRVLVPEEYPPPPRSWFQDYDDMLEDTWQTSDSLYPSGNGGYGMWDNYPMFPTRLKKFDNIGLVEAIVSSILSTGRVDLQRKLFCSIQLVGGAASTAGLAPVLEQRILNKIPANQSVERVEVLQSRTYPLFVPWKGGVILGVLDTGRDAWIHREDWIKNGVHIGSGRKYKDSYFLQAQVMCYYNI
ncbi:actin-related protein 9 isoform X1 [Panicum virgatum]|uniref:actin-related protein 9 isoform X1 n=1 Tax=Panicum virgatum TaxID=38727 RepID=UPI0019D6404A|nr:actin-related protein 9 isoform X1 [Panicum virgatum]XP_039821772.1 actin-related protein 9 isoform X1 [Panicum virgatum]